VKADHQPDARIERGSRSELISSPKEGMVHKATMTVTAR
jgi:hypothetical protein